MLHEGVLLVHVPHAATDIPEKFRGSILLSDDLLIAEQDKMTDWYVDKLFRDVEQVVFPYSRLFCDVERYSDDTQEPMASLGMGFYYLRTHDGKLLRSANPVEREEVYLDFYAPHHKSLRVKSQERIDKYGCCVLIDCHSYDESVPWVHGRGCPDICLGLNSPNSELCAAVKNLCNMYGYSFAVNMPFEGSLIPCGVESSKVCSVMLEINKRVYITDGRKMEFSNFSRLQDFARELKRLLL